MSNLSIQGYINIISVPNKNPLIPINIRMVTATTAVAGLTNKKILNDMTV